MKTCIEITDTNFDELALRSPLPVLIDFTAAWCAPCRAIAPHVEAIARDVRRPADRRHLRRRFEPDARRAPGRARMPTLLLFGDGQILGQIIGAVPRAKIEALVARALPAPRRRRRCDYGCCRDSDGPRPAIERPVQMRTSSIAPEK